MHICVPPVQDCVVPDAHTPPPLHVPHPPHTFPLQLRACVPVLQLPHAWLAVPLPVATVQSAVRWVPQVSVAVRLPQFFPSREQNAAFVSAGHTQVPQVHCAVQVCVPPVQLCVAVVAHTPWPVQVPHVPHVPLLHVRDWVPQFPHACDVDPVQV